MFGIYQWGSYGRPHEWRVLNELAGIGGSATRHTMLLSILKSANSVRRALSSTEKL
jgi:hypothetical protein